MSNQAIYIELQGRTPCVAPRYTRPPRAPRSPNLMVRYSRNAICHTNFGIRESEFGIWKPDNSCSALSYFAFAPVNIGPNAVHRILHGAVFSY